MEILPYSLIRRWYDPMNECGGDEDDPMNEYGGDDDDPMNEYGGDDEEQDDHPAEVVCECLSEVDALFDPSPDFGLFLHVMEFKYQNHSPHFHLENILDQITSQGDDQELAKLDLYQMARTILWPITLHGQRIEGSFSIVKDQVKREHNNNNLTDSHLSHHLLWINVDNECKRKALDRFSVDGVRVTEDRRHAYYKELTTMMQGHLPEKIIPENRFPITEDFNMMRLSMREWIEEQKKWEKRRKPRQNNPKCHCVRWPEDAKSFCITIYQKMNGGSQSKRSVRTLLREISTTKDVIAYLNNTMKCKETCTRSTLERYRKELGLERQKHDHWVRNSFAVMLNIGMKLLPDATYGMMGLHDRIQAISQHNVNEDEVVSGEVRKANNRNEQHIAQMAHDLRKQAKQNGNPTRRRSQRLDSQRKKKKAKKNPDHISQTVDQGLVNYSQTALRSRSQ